MTRLERIQNYVDKENEILKELNQKIKDLSPRINELCKTLGECYYAGFALKSFSHGYSIVKLFECRNEEQARTIMPKDLTYTTDTLDTDNNKTYYARVSIAPYIPENVVSEPLKEYNTLRFCLLATEGKKANSSDVCNFCIRNGEVYCYDEKLGIKRGPTINGVDKNSLALFLKYYDRIESEIYSQIDAELNNINN